MKNIFIILLSAYFCIMSLNGTYANNDNKSIGYIPNTELNIKGSKLIERYLKSLIYNLSDLQNKYSLEENIEINSYKDTLNKMVKSLISTQNTDIPKEYAEKTMKKIINDLKFLNIKIKKLLKEEKEKQEKELKKIKETYHNIGTKLSSQLNKIILKILLPLKSKDILTDDDKKIIYHLKILKQQSDKLKNIINIPLSNKEEIKKYLLEILKIIKNNIKEIKKES